MDVVNALKEQSENILSEIELLELAIQHYIQIRGDEALSYASYFNKRFPLLKEMVKGINAGINQVTETEGK